MYLAHFVLRINVPPLTQDALRTYAMAAGNEEGSFEAVAGWWDGHAGDEGDANHRHLILPALLAALGDLSGQQVLDLGCGNGASSRTLARKGALVTGVDLSPSLVALARQRETSNPLGINYFVADATHLRMFPTGSFASVVANTVLMDARDGEGIMGEAARLLPTGGRFVASLLHPCFEVPGQSDWAREETASGDRWIRRIWGYREPFSTLDRMTTDQPAPIMRYHRPLSWYVARPREAGFLVDTLDEPVGDSVFAHEKPRSAQRMGIVPSFLVVGATKVRSV